MFPSIITLFMKIIPDNLISFAVGWLARIELPLVQGFLNKTFVSIFGIDMDEAQLRLSEYKSIEDVFTRKLKEGARPLAQPEDEMIHIPCDGTLSVAGKITDESMLVQAKGLQYNAYSLVFGDGPIDPTFDPDFFATIYLAPHNYHRVHTPVSGRLVKVRYIPGALIPVNQPFVRWFPKLFSKNERMVFDIVTNDGSKCYVVMVGAFNVGRIQTNFWPELVSNDLGRLLNGRIDQKEIATDFVLKAGAELGTFMLGSTAVLVFDKATNAQFALNRVEQSRKVKLGEALAQKKED